MTLEKSIHQKEFRNEHQKALLNILYTYSYLVGKTNDVFKDFEITRQQYNVLRILRGQHPKPSTVNLLKERMLDKMSDASRLVDRLLKKSLVERHICPDDRRAVDIFITKQGLELLKKIDEENKNFKLFLSHLTEKEMKQLNDLLDKLRG